jgi:predicted alpha-1,6-mannanase (GH76 family)
VIPVDSRVEHAGRLKSEHAEAASAEAHETVAEIVAATAIQMMSRRMRVEGLLLMASR